VSGEKSLFGTTCESLNVNAWSFQSKSEHERHVSTLLNTINFILWTSTQSTSFKNS
jgi:hypothetical protein